MIDRRMFLKGLVAGAAGILVPERKIWALDQSMLAPSLMGGEREWVDGPPDDVCDYPGTWCSGWFDTRVPDYVKIFNPEDTPFIDQLLRAQKEYRKAAEREIIYNDRIIGVVNTQGFSIGSYITIITDPNMHPNEMAVITGVFPSINKMTITGIGATE